MRAVPIQENRGLPLKALPSYEFALFVEKRDTMHVEAAHSRRHDAVIFFLSDFNAAATSADGGDVVALDLLVVSHDITSYVVGAQTAIHL